MTYQKRYAQIRWQDYATRDEAEELGRIALECQTIDSRRIELSRRLRTLRDRCYARERSRRITAARPEAAE